MTEFVDYIVRRLPYSFWVEEVPGFAKPLAKLRRRAPVQVITASLKAKGYGCRALILHHQIFVKVLRTRVFFWGCHADAGGQRGADHILSLVQAVIAHVEQNGDALHWLEIVDVHGEEEIRRRRNAEVICI